jgi:hypothetical protein
MVLHSQAFKLLQQTWSYTAKLSSFCNKHGLSLLSFQAFATNMVLHIQAFKLFCNKHGLTQSSFQAFATNMVLHSRAFKLLQQTWSYTVKLLANDKTAFFTQYKIMAFVTNRTVRYEGTDCRIPDILDRT